MVGLGYAFEEFTIGRLSNVMFSTVITSRIGLSSALRPRQHSNDSIGYRPMETVFTGQKTQPTVSTGT